MYLKGKGKPTQTEKPQEQAKAQAQGGQPGADAGQAQDAGAAPADDVVDAEFEEVKDDK